MRYGSVSKRAVAFALGLTLLTGLAALTWKSLSGALTPFRATRVGCACDWRQAALTFGPSVDRGAQISRDKLRKVLVLLEPRWKIPKSNDLLHALRLWGITSEFDDTELPNLNRAGMPSGAVMLEILTNDREFRRLGIGPYPFLYPSKRGVEVLFGGAGGGVAHRDQYLKVMGELGLEASAPIKLADGQTRALADVIRDSLLVFDPGQELDFTAIAYSHWLPPTDRWINRFGREFSFDWMCEQLMLAKRTSGSCHGCHRLYALVSILRAHGVHPILSPRVARQVRRYLSDTSRLLERTQAQSGLWFAKWDGLSDANSAGREGLEAVFATGHHLEWAALSPPDLAPNEKSVRRAGLALADLILSYNSYTIAKYYAPFSHAARALALLEKVDAASLIKERPIRQPGITASR